MASGSTNNINNRFQCYTTMSRITKHKLNKSVARYEPKKSRMSKKMIWTLILGGLMVASVFGIMFSSYNSGNDKLKYGEYKFEKAVKRLPSGMTQEIWTVDIDGKKAEFSYFPGDLEEFELDPAIGDLLARSKVVYLTFDPSTKNVGKFELMRLEMAESLADFGKYPVPGIIEEHEQYSQPIVDCGNATEMVPVVSLVEGNETNARLEGGCIVLEANEYSTTALKDRVIYSMLGIMD